MFSMFFRRLFCNRKSVLLRKRVWIRNRAVHRSATLIPGSKRAYHVVPISREWNPSRACARSGMAMPPSASVIIVRSSVVFFSFCSPLGVRYGNRTATFPRARSAGARKKETKEYERHHVVRDFTRFVFSVAREVRVSYAGREVAGARAPFSSRSRVAGTIRTGVPRLTSWRA